MQFIESKGNGQLDLVYVSNEDVQEYALEYVSAVRSFGASTTQHMLRDVLGEKYPSIVASLLLQIIQEARRLK